MSHEKSTPAPLETDPGQQKDDNIDDLGRRDDGKQQDQPVEPSRRGEGGKPSTDKKH
jgi:hypothetical protein